jgi:hypothetical protein
MKQDENWNWMEGLFNRVPIPYPIVSITIAFLLYLTFILFNNLLIQKSWPSQKIQLLAFFICTLIAYQMAGIQYLLNVMKIIVLQWDKLFFETGNSEYTLAKERFEKSHWYYAIVALVMIPFYLVDWVPLLQQGLWMHFQSTYLEIFLAFQNIWLLLFNIFLKLVGLVTLFLLANILWIIINIAWALRDTKMLQGKCLQKLGIYSARMRLISIRSLIFKILSYYFICIALFIIAYLTPTPNNFYGKETGLLLILLSIGVIFFFLGLDALQKVLIEQVKCNLDLINKEYQDQTQKLLEITSRRKYNNENEELSFTSNALDALQKQRDQLEGINTNVFDLYSIAKFIGSFLLTFIIPFLTSKSADAANFLESNPEIASTINHLINVSITNAHNFLPIQ